MQLHSGWQDVHGFIVVVTQVTGATCVRDNCGPLVPVTPFPQEWIGRLFWSQRGLGEEEAGLWWENFWPMNRSHPLLPAKLLCKSYTSSCICTLGRWSCQLRTPGACMGALDAHRMVGSFSWPGSCSRMGGCCSCRRTAKWNITAPTSLINKTK